mmetsp:Transcript_11032/g.35146  ORF Transcript_11032/g.35146 Transcript_11032/m.35146 type:complete len:670 (+) Transcript_11032:126-2135(+)
MVRSLPANRRREFYGTVSTLSGRGVTEQKLLTLSAFCRRELLDRLARALSRCSACVNLDPTNAESGKDANALLADLLHGVARLAVHRVANCKSSCCLLSGCVRAEPSDQLLELGKLAAGGIYEAGGVAEVGLRALEARLRPLAVFVELLDGGRRGLCWGSLGRRGTFSLALSKPLPQLLYPTLFRVDNAFELLTLGTVLIQLCNDYIRVRRVCGLAKPPGLFAKVALPTELGVLLIQDFLVEHLTVSWPLLVRFSDGAWRIANGARHGLACQPSGFLCSSLVCLVSAPVLKPLQDPAVHRTAQLESFLELRPLLGHGPLREQDHFVEVFGQVESVLAHVSEAFLHSHNVLFDMRWVCLTHLRHPNEEPLRMLRLADFGQHLVNPCRDAAKHGFAGPHTLLRELVLLISLIDGAHELVKLPLLEIGLVDQRVVRVPQVGQRPVQLGHSCLVLGWNIRLKVGGKVRAHVRNHRRVPAKIFDHSFEGVANGVVVEQATMEDVKQRILVVRLAEIREPGALAQRLDAGRGKWHFIRRKLVDVVKERAGAHPKQVRVARRARFELGSGAFRRAEHGGEGRQLWRGPRLLRPGRETFASLFLSGRGQATERATELSRVLFLPRPKVHGHLAHLYERADSLGAGLEAAHCFGRLDLWEGELTRPLKIGRDSDCVDM